MKYEFFYDDENDVLSIYKKDFKVKETVEFADFLNLDLDKQGNVVGFEIFYASSFIESMGNDEKISLNEIESIDVVEKDFRNTWYSILLLKAKNKKHAIEYSMPLLNKKEYRSPLISN